MINPQTATADGHFTNGVLSPEAAEDLDHPDESKKERKKRNKKEKKARRAMVERLHPRLDALPPTELAAVEEKEEEKAQPALRLQTWLRSVSASLDTLRVLTAHKSSFLIAINCLMLAIAAHALYQGLDAGPLRWALLPLALTNLLSLTFAIRSAQVGTAATALDALWAMPEEDYAPAVAAMLEDKQRVYQTLSSELHQLGSELQLRQRSLRTAYSVLLGGVAVSSCVFAILVATGARS